MQDGRARCWNSKTKLRIPKSAEDAEGKVNGALKVEVFWSHALRPGERPKSPPSGPKPAGAAASAAEPAEALVAPGAAAETAKVGSTSMAISVLAFAQSLCVAARTLAGTMAMSRSCTLSATTLLRVA